MDDDTGYYSRAEMDLMADRHSCRDVRPVLLGGVGGFF